MKQYIIRDREAGNIIDKFNTLKEAETTLARFEASDKVEGIYVENFYEIVEEGL